MGRLMVEKMMLLTGYQAPTDWLLPGSKLLKLEIYCF